MNEGGEVGAQRFDFEAGHVLGELVAVGADVAHAAGGAGASRVGAPRRLLLAGRLEPLGEPALRVLDHHLADGAESPARDQALRLFHHRIAGVVVGETEESSARLDPIADRERLWQIERHRLVADQVEAALERRHRHRMVEVVGGHDGDEVDALRRSPLRLAIDHLAPRRVAAIRVEVKIPSRCARGVGIRGERPAYQLDRAVEGRRHAMDRADEGAAAAADHSHAQTSLHREPGS